MKRENNESFVQRYVQYSKKITLFGMIQWCVLALMALGIAVFSMTAIGTLNEYSMGVVKTVVIWAATVAFVSVGSYEANSAIEKSVRAKVNAMIETEIGKASAEEKSNSSECG